RLSGSFTKRLDLSETGWDERVAVLPARSPRLLASVEHRIRADILPLAKFCTQVRESLRRLRPPCRSSSPFADLIETYCNSSRFFLKIAPSGSELPRKQARGAFILSSLPNKHFVRYRDWVPLKSS